MSTEPATLSDSALQALAEFRRLKDTEYYEVWRSLPPPRFGELHGEYAGELPPNYNDLHKRWQATYLCNEQSPTGFWLGKAYTPLGQATGEGYNMFRMPDGRTERRSRFGTHLGTSRIDGRPAVNMTYASFEIDDPANVDTVDEVRKLADGVFIVAMTQRLAALQTAGLPEIFSSLFDVYRSYGLEVAQASSYHERTPPQATIVILKGPVAAYVGADEVAAAG